LEKYKKSGVMKKNKFFLVLVLILINQMILSESTNAGLNINHIQFVGSHNSYKRAMPNGFVKQLMKVNPKVMESLEYEHIPLAEQLDLGIRKLELDVFYVAREDSFLVGHVQQIDMNSSCTTLRICLNQIIAWSQKNPSHAPIWISFNTKDDYIFGLTSPETFSPTAFNLMDSIIEEMLGEKLIRPRDIVDLQWPLLEEARGKFILILDEGGPKRDMYYEGWQQRPMFTNAPEGHPANAIMIINDPIGQFEEIQRLVKAGYMVRTRADADTREARDNDTRRRAAAFASGAQAISTDYYMPATHFGNQYQVILPEPIQCNPVIAPQICQVSEKLIE
jgi:hypothetical protein|tara:strand:+ start:99 stop:1103 length:1005 start_codon:yes stop_codon:yes gene_type:complete